MTSAVSCYPASKRRKLSPSTTPLDTPAQLQTDSEFENEMAEARKTAEDTTGLQTQKEAQVGILRFVNETNPGFSGILKQRYTDFLVNEITPDGKVVHLTSTFAISSESNSEHGSGDFESPETLKASPNAMTSSPSTQHNGTPDKDADSAYEGDESMTFMLSPEDQTLLDSYLGCEVRETVLRLYRKILQRPDAKAAAIGSVMTDPIKDKERRIKFHQDMRRIFREKFETAADANGVIKISLAVRRNPQPKEIRPRGRGNRGHQQQKGKLGWQELGGEHLHFTLYKENKDTMEVISFISARLQMRAKSFAFAGTKDRRAVTVQRISVFRVRAENLVGLNKILYGCKIGNFSYEKHGLELGELTGNEFLVTLRDCKFQGSEMLSAGEKVDLAHQIVSDAVTNIQKHGFINYFGLQRFGTYTIGTEEVGMKILQGDFEGAVASILWYSDEALAAVNNPDFVSSDGRPISRDDSLRARALHLFKTTGKGFEAGNQLPRKFNTEFTILRHLDRNDRRKDFLGALLVISRNLRLMYVHAYQSLVWNMVATERWARFGNKVIEGDLVIVDIGETKTGRHLAIEEVDENGEIIILPAADDVAISHDDMFERARPLTAEEASSGKYTIFDIVLPTPGFDIEYPNNEIGDYYKEFMASPRGGGLDPANMRRPQKDFSLSGSYRKLIGQVGNDMSFEVKAYSDDNEQMVETDLDRLNKKRGQNRKSRTPPNNLRRPQDRPHTPIKDEDKDIRKKTAASLSAWIALPAKLAAEDKAAAELAAVQRAMAKEGNATPANMSQPTFKETFIETSAEKGQRTGHRETNIMAGIQSQTQSTQTLKVESSKVPDNPTTPVAGLKTAKNKRLSNISNADSFSSSDQSDGGVRLDIEYSPFGDDSAASDSPSASPSTRLREISVKNETVTPLKNEIKRSAENAFCGDGANDEELQTTRTKIAVIVKFQLGSSQYATMALRELMKQGGVQTYKPEFSSAR